MDKRYRPGEAGRQYQTDGSQDAGTVASMAIEPSEQGRRAVEISCAKADAASCTGWRGRTTVARRISGRAASADVDLIVCAADCLRQSCQPDAGARHDAEAADFSTSGARRASPTVGTT